MHPAAMLPPSLAYLGSVQVRTVGWPQSWSNEVWCFTNSYTVSRALWAGALSCRKVKKSPDGREWLVEAVDEAKHFDNIVLYNVQ